MQQFSRVTTAVLLAAALTAVPTAAIAQTAPANDDFANATTLSGDAGSLAGQTNVDATAEPGEPVHDGSSGGQSVWYQWTPSVGGNAVITVTTPPVPDDWDSVLAVYTGAAVDSLTEVAARNTTLQTLELEFPVVAGTTYHLAIDGYDSADTGSFDLSWLTEVPPPNDDFADATAMTSDNGALPGPTTKLATAEPGEPSHDGHLTTPVHSVWFEWTPSEDALATLVVTTPSTPDDWDSVLAVYTGSTVDSLTEIAAQSTVGTTLPLEFAATGGVTYRVAVDGQDTDQMGAFDLEWSTWPDSQDFVVTKTEDTDDGACDADCSLREAVVAANSTPGDDTITLPSGHYELTLDWWGVADHYGSLDIEREMGTTSILGAGRDVTTIDATTLRTVGLSRPDRVFTVDYQAGLELVGVTVTGGYTENALSADQDGGGIWALNAALTITDSIVEGNVAGVNGGGIANHFGTATITNSIIRNNTNPPDYSTWSKGGGVYNTGAMTIVDSTIEFNESSNDGGGIWSEKGNVDEYPATIDIFDSLIRENTAVRGGGFGNGRQSTATVTGSTLTDNGATRSWDVTLGTNNRGGGMFNWGTATVIDSTIAGNVAMATHDVDPASGGGGGIANHMGTLTVIGSTLTGNVAICDQALPGDPALCGRGGGLVNAGGVAEVTNATISGNTTDLLNGNHGAYRGGGGGGGVAHMPQKTPGPGGSWVIICPITVLDSVTITGNDAAHGGGINSRWESWGAGLYDVAAWEVGDNVYECPDLYVTNSIIAGNATTFTVGTEDSWGGYASLGYNLVGAGTGAPSDGPGDLTTLDARLEPLADNGGPTLTHLPLWGSPAVDAGATDETVDQRGVARPVGAADDIGAVEAPVYPTPDRVGILTPDGVVSVKEGALAAPWVVQAAGVADFQLDGDRIAILKPNGRLFAKDGPLTGTWPWLANGVADFQLDGDRVGMLSTGGVLSVKKGALGAPWVVQAVGVAEFQLEGDRIAILKPNGRLFAKDGPLTGTWTWLANGVADFQLDGDRVGMLATSGVVSVKEGALAGPWVVQAAGVAEFQLEGDRVAILKPNGRLFAKDGPLTGTWTWLANGVADFQLDGDRVGMLATSGVVSVKEGALAGPWVVQAAGVAEFQLEGDRVAILKPNGRLFAKDGPLTGTWTWLANGVADFQLT